MGLEVGNILEGKVTGITSFGAFVDLPDGNTGMVHISEVAPTYVSQIKDHLTEGQIVKVKVLTIAENGKISLSIKKAMEKPQEHNNHGGNRPSRPHTRPPRRPVAPAKPVTSPGNFEWQSAPKTSTNASFEDMMSRFKQTSDDKISDLKKGSDVGARRPRRSTGGGSK